MQIGKNVFLQEVKNMMHKKEGIVKRLKANFNKNSRLLQRTFTINILLK